MHLAGYIVREVNESKVTEWGRGNDMKLTTIWILIPVAMVGEPWFGGGPLESRQKGGAMAAIFTELSLGSAIEQDGATGHSNLCGFTTPLVNGCSYGLCEQPASSIRTQ